MRLTLRNLTKSCCANRSLSSHLEPIRFLAHVGKTSSLAAKLQRALKLNAKERWYIPKKPMTWKM